MIHLLCACVCVCVFRELGRDRSVCGRGERG